MKPCKVIFMGTPELARTVLEKLITSRTFAPSLVITQPDRPVGRKRTMTPPPVKLCAEKHGIPVLQPEKLKDPAFIERIKDENPDVIVVAAYGKIIPKTIIDIPPRGILNVHASLLPKYRGASPAQYALLSGEAITGVTIMLIDEGLDTGPIISQNTVVVDPRETTETLLEKLADCGGDLLVRTLPDWCAGTVEAYEQNPAEAALTKILKKEDGLITTDHSADQIERMIRAFTPWPGAYIRLSHADGTTATLKIISARVIPCFEKRHPLELFLSDAKEVCLATRDQCLALDIVQPEGKNPMSGKAFWNGYHPI